MPKNTKKAEPEVSPLDQIIESFSEKTNAAENFLRALDRLYRAFPDAEFSPTITEQVEKLRDFAAGRTAQALRNQIAENLADLTVWMG